MTVPDLGAGVSNRVPAGTRKAGAEEQTDASTLAGPAGRPRGNRYLLQP